MIQTDNSKVEQMREHSEIYLNKVTKAQSKFIALHVGLFWGIGRFIIKNEDHVIIKTDDKSMISYLLKNEISSDEFIKTRIRFIDQLINQRKLKINYELITIKKILLKK